jgi:hypothetical protein
MFLQNPEPKSRLLARLIRELLHGETFDTLADLADALKFRCARLKVRWTPDDISEAFRLIETNTPLVRPRVVRRLEERPPEPEIIDKKFAADFFKELALGIRTMAPAPWRDPEQEAADEQAARERAWEMGIEL